MANNDSVERAKRKWEELKKGGQNTATPSSSRVSTTTKTSDGVSRAKRKWAELSIGVDTLGNDLANVGSTLETVYSGWQSPEALKSARASFDDVYGRLGKAKEHGVDLGFDVDSVLGAYETVLGDWDKLESNYGYYKDADSYAKAVKQSELAKQFKEGMTYDEVQEALKQYKEGSDEYEYLSGYTGYATLEDLDRAIDAIPKKEEKSFMEKVKDFDIKDHVTGMVVNDSFLGRALGYDAPQTYEEKLQLLRNQKALDHASEPYMKLMENEDFEAKSQYVPSELEGWWNKLTDGQYGLGYGDITYEYINNVNGARDAIEHKASIYGLDTGDRASSQFKKAYHEMNDDEIRIYNYLYAKDKEEGTNTAKEYLDSIEMMLTKRATDKMEQGIEKTVDGETKAEGALASTALSALSIPANVIGSVYTGAEVLTNALSGKHSNPYGYYRGLTNASSSIREEVGENIEQETSAEFLGTNVARFLYDTGMSIGDSALGVAMTGQALAPLMGATAFQQKAKEMTEAGESEDVIFKTALASGLAEAVFEYASIDKLLKIKDVDSLKRIVTEALKQAGVEASEEIFTEIANTWSDDFFRGGNSEIAKMQEELKSRGFSDEETAIEIAKYVGGKIALAGIGGAISGGVMGGGASVNNYIGLRSDGKSIRESERMTDAFDMASLSPKESEAYKAYSEYAKKGITADNATDAQLGNLSANLQSDAIKTAKSKKATDEERLGAFIRLADDKLHTPKTAEEKAKEQKAKEEVKAREQRLNALSVSEVTEVASTGNATQIEGIKTEDGETVIVTSEGEVKASEMNFSQTDAELVAYAEGMSDEKANLFIAQYDGQSKVSDYAESFNMAYLYGETGFGADSVLKNKGVLTEVQASEIYKSAMFTKAKAQQKAIADLNAKYGKAMIVKGTFTDDIIDYDGTSTGTGKVKWEDLTPTQRDAINLMRGFSEATGVNIKLIKSEVVNGKHKGKNGSYNPDTNTIEIDVYAGRIDASAVEDSIIPTLSHEVTHWMKAKSPSIYSQMRELVMTTLAEGGKYTSKELVHKEMIRMREAHPDIKVTEEMAIDELIARGCEDMLSNSNEVRKLLNRLSKDEQSTFIDKVKKTFKDLMNWVNELLGKYKSTSKEAELLRAYKHKLSQLSKMWDKALTEAMQTNQNLQKEGITGEQLINQTLRQIGLEYDAQTQTVFSMRSLEDAFDYNEGAEAYLKARNEYVDALVKATGKTKEEANRYLDGLFLVHDMIANDQARLDYESAVNKSAWVSNSEYGGSIDFSTLCAKRRLFTGTMDAIHEALPDAVLSEMDFLTIRDMLLKKDLESPCSMCYVEGSRAKADMYIKQWLDEYLATNPSWKPRMRDFTNVSRLEQTRLNHPEAYNSFQEAMNKLAQRKPKEASVRTDYKGEILVAFEDGSTVKIKNENGGIRFNSFSDFEIIHALDCMQVITDMARVGLAGQGYTKVKEFAECFGNTGLKINLSLVAKGVDANGKLIFDEVNGMKYSEAMELRNKYSKNVGTVIVAFTNEQIKAALSDPTIDYVLPFHRSQWRKAQYTLMGLPVGTKDYTNVQNDRINNPNTGRAVKLSKIKAVTNYTNPVTGEVYEIKDNIMPNMYWDYTKSGRENAQEYLNYINANKMTPKFQFLLQRVDGKWVLPDGAVGDGYFKLLIDFKMYDNNGVGSPQMPVLPEFNMPYIQQMLEDYKGGHQSFPVAHDVVDEFVAEYKKKHPNEQYSDRDSEGTQLTEGQKKYFAESKVRDAEGRLVPVFHGTSSYGFTIFDPSKADDKRSLFFTDNYEMAQSYVNDDSKAYKVYLNLKNPMIVDGEGRMWNHIRLNKSENEIVEKCERYIELAQLWDDQIDFGTFAETLGNLVDSTEYILNDEEGSAFTEEESAEMLTLAKEIDEAYEAWNAEEHLDEDGDETEFARFVRENRSAYYRTRQIAKMAQEQGHDGVIFKNIQDNGKYARQRGVWSVGNVYVAFNSEQAKLTTNENPTEHKDIRYSDRDSEGNHLTNEQIEYFKDSKVRWGGKLLPVYHGTSEEFTVFESIVHGGLMWASKDAEYAEQFGDTQKYYLNITNMLDIGDIDSYTNYDDAIAELARKVGMTPKDLEAMDADAEYLFEITNSEAFKNRIVELGYDGVMAYESGLQTFGFVNSNQIKLTTNENPTEDADIRYSDRDFMDAVESGGIEVAQMLVSDVDNSLRFSDRDVEEYEDTYKLIGNSVMNYKVGNRPPDLTVVEVDGKPNKNGEIPKELTVKFVGDRPENYIPKKIGYAYKLMELHPDGTLHALFAGTDKGFVIGEWNYAQGFPRTDAGVKSMGLRERYAWHLGTGLPSTHHLMGVGNVLSPKMGYYSKADLHPKGSKRVWVRCAYDASNDWNGIADLNGRNHDIYGLIPFGGYYSFQENNLSEWVLSSAIKFDKILTEEERQQILREAGHDEKAEWQKKVLASKLRASMTSTLKAIASETNDDKIAELLEKKAILEKLMAENPYQDWKDATKKPTKKEKEERSVQSRKNIASGIIDNPELIARDSTRFSDRDNVSLYETIGEDGRLAEENAKLAEDIAKLASTISGDAVSIKRFRSLADYLKKLAGSNVSREVLGDRLKELYEYIQTTPDAQWNNVMAKSYDIARDIMNVFPDVTPNYFRSVMTEIRKDKVTLSPNQNSEAVKMFGSYADFHKRMFGRVNIVNEGTPLTEMWSKWSQKYPTIFDANLTETEQIQALVDILDALKTTSSLMSEYEREEAIRHLSTEVYNQFWNIASDASEDVKKLRADHRKLMEDLRKSYEARQKESTLHPAGEVALKYEQLLRKVKEADAKEMAKVKELGQKRMTDYKDRVAKNARIERITKKALTLNQWLLKNSKDEHIPEVMKEPVAYLLSAIDFSSKQLLGMRGGERANTPTKKDISLSKALEKVHDMVKGINDAQIGEDDISTIYGTFADFPVGFADDVKLLSGVANDLLRKAGDNAFILNDMTLEQLEEFDRIITTLKTTVTKMNKFLAIRHAEGVANMSQQDIVYLDSLGKRKTYDGKIGGVDKMLQWGNATPYYAFKRFGEGGKKVMDAIMNGWDKYSFHVRDIIDYTEQTYTDKEAKEWAEDIKEFDILIPPTDADRASKDYEPQYQKVQMSVPQIMALYCTVKRAQAKTHLFGGGMRVADIKGKNGVISQPDGAILTESELEKITSTLTDRQREVADALQRFMNTTCSDWGNDVSMIRFGIKQFGEENYFPIQSDRNNLAVDDETERNNSLFRLLNMSFTKSLTEGANNRIVIGDIFDVFAQHASDMAKYNALALPILDAFKWYNYKEKVKRGKDTQFTTMSLKQSLETAFGKDAQSYITTFLKDINGAESGGRDSVGGGFFTNAKIASVGFNARVIALQPTSYVRANAVIDPKYLARAFTRKPNIKMAEQYCGIALWKSLGFFDINIQKSVTTIIKHEQTTKDKLVEASMKGAEKADKLTWGYLWNACEIEVREKNPNLVGEELYQKVGLRLREVIYSTQVVDSTVTRSQMMRSKDGRDKMITAFMSEPTLAYNMLQDAYYDWKLTERQTGSKEKAFKKHGKKMARVFAAYTVTNMLSALVEAGFDIFRDTDDEEITFEDFMKQWGKNLGSNMSILGKIPYAKEIVSFLEGYSSSRTDTQWMQYIATFGSGIVKLLEGKGNAYKTAKDGLKAFSYFTGLPMYNAWRDLTALGDKVGFEVEELEEMFNDTIGSIFPSLKSK